jgi:hypothetical protein
MTTFEVCMYAFLVFAVGIGVVVVLGILLDRKRK